MTETRPDRRRTCYCGHRYGTHAKGGTQCLAVVNDPDRTSLVPCYCHEYEPRSRLGGVRVVDAAAGMERVAQLTRIAFAEEPHDA